MDSQPVNTLQPPEQQSSFTNNSTPIPRKHGKTPVGLIVAWLGALPLAVVIAFIGAALFRGKEPSALQTLINIFTILLGMYGVVGWIPLLIVAISRNRKNQQ